MQDKAKLQIDFQSGFSNDTVVVRLGDDEVWRKSGLRTRYQIGLAESFATFAHPGAIELTIELPERHLIRKIPLRLEQTLYVAANVTEDGQLQLRTQDGEFHYL